MATTLSTSSSGPAPLATLNQPPFLSKNLDQTRVSCSTGIRSTTVPLPGASSASSAAVVNPELYVSPEWLAALLKRSSGSSSNNSLNSSSVCSDKTSSIPFKVRSRIHRNFFLLTTKADLGWWGGGGLPPQGFDPLPIQGWVPSLYYFEISICGDGS